MTSEGRATRNILDNGPTTFPKPRKSLIGFSKARKSTGEALEAHGGCFVLRAFRPWVVIRTDYPIGVSLGKVEREKDCAGADRRRQPSRHTGAAPPTLDLDGFAVGDREPGGVLGVYLELVDGRQRAA